MTRSHPHEALPEAIVAAYLRRLGLERADVTPPSPAGLRLLHARHVERIAYETLWIGLAEGDPSRLRSIEPVASAQIIAAGWGGYCFHLNGGFGALLHSLGYAVSRHLGGVQGPVPSGANGNHLVLLVADLPSPDCPGGLWYCDVGLGESPYEPLPLAPGTVTQGGFSYTLRQQGSGGGPIWRYEHDIPAPFSAMEFTTAPADEAVLLAQHRTLSTHPASGFVRTLIAVRRDATGVDALRGLLLARAGEGASPPRELTTEAEYAAALTDVFGLPMDSLEPEARRALWRRVRADHEAWQARRAQPPSG